MKPEDLYLKNIDGTFIEDEIGENLYDKKKITQFNNCQIDEELCNICLESKCPNFCEEPNCDHCSIYDCNWREDNETNLGI